jgi:hypothetical protein
MIELYRSADCPGCADIEATLQELVVAHKVIMVEPGHSPSPPVELPAIQESGQWVSGPEAITIYLRELAGFVTRWRRFQSDSCYIDDDGEIC